MPTPHVPPRFREDNTEGYDHLDLTTDRTETTMAYDPSNLSALAYSNGFTLWHYKTPDAPESVAETGYFNDGANMLRVGDFVIVNADITGQMDSGIVVVSSTEPDTVRVASVTP